jgi:CHAT domain-containing protein
MEALSVAKQHGTVPLLGEQATEAAVTQRLRNAGLVHLATHGLISEIAPTASALALQGTDRLTVADLAGLRFGADLVVLSACDTGRGDTTIGGDVVGLARQLLAAGARAAVVSLWPVDDDATCLLMNEFHRRLHHGNTAAEALARAQALLRSLTIEERDKRYVELCQSVGENPVTTKPRRRTWRATPSPARGHGAGIMRDAAQWAGFVLIGRP